MAWGTVPGTGDLLMESSDNIQVGVTQTTTLTGYSVGGTVTLDGSFVVGNPTGGSQGFGTINAETVYDDGSALCAPVEEYLKGEPSDRKEWDSLSPKGGNRAFTLFSETKSQGYDGSLFGFQTVIRNNQSVPGLINKEEMRKRIPQSTEDHFGKISLTEKVERLWVAVDILGVSLDQVIEENKDLKSRINSLESRL